MRSLSSCLLMLALLLSPFKGHSQCYSQVFLDDMAGGLVGYGQIDSAGNINNAQLSPAAYDYLTTNGYMSSADTWKIGLALSCLVMDSL